MQLHRNGNNKKKRNLQIEGLRGFAILIIVLYHLINRFQQLYLDSFVHWMDMWGTLGTTIFLIISAYFLIDCKDSTSLYKVIKLFLKKILRLWPCYAICLTLIFFITHIWFLPERTVTLRDYFFNLFFLNRFFNIPYVDGSHWYLNVLISVTIIILLLSFFNQIKNQFIYILWLLIELLIDELTSFSNMYLLGGPFVGVICVGISIRCILEIISTKDFDNKYDAALIKWFFVIALSIICTFISRGLICAIELVLVGFIFTLCVLKKITFLDNRILIFIGSVSYPLYLIHQNIGFIIEFQISIFFGNWNYVISLIAILSVLLIAIFIYYFAEKPIQRKLSLLFR